MAASLLHALLFLSTSAAHAQVGGLSSPFVTGSIETWAGAEATRHSWSSYTGVSWAPLGTLAGDGLRLRVSGGYGEYRHKPTSLYGTVAFADLLTGYQMAFGPLTLKAWAGASFEGRLHDRPDQELPELMSATGAKWALEGWLNLSPSMWVQVDVADSSAARFMHRLRLGWRLTNTISIGLETGGYGHAVSSIDRRGGAFARYEWLGGELAVSTGLQLVAEQGDGRRRNPYGTVMYMTRF